MPKRTDIKKIMLIGSGPIVIGQACEFDYSGTQACKALREDGFEVVLINSNPATVMTDPDLADRTYIEPITPEVVAKILERERPDALLPTVGGQTALNTAVSVAESGLLDQLKIELIGAKLESIKKAEDRDLFRSAMQKIGLEIPKSASVTSLKEARQFVKEVGFPVIIRASFTLGGTGASIAFRSSEFDELLLSGLAQSPVGQVLVEESILGWKEYELELMRDLKDNVVIVCSIENFDPMGVHTGDSITVAPAQTLSDKEYQVMRDAAVRVIREIGVDTGGSNIQFAIHPKNGRMVVIEMNPRVSRSSALASKATGFPIAKIATKLAVGYTLDEIVNDITRCTPASFEPSIDYVVTKIPRFTFEKFPLAKQILGPQMKSVGEAMAIGRTFKESLQKGIRSLEISRYGFEELDVVRGKEGKDLIRKKLSEPNPDRLWFIAEAFRRGFTIKDIHRLSRIDPWFLHHVEEIIRFEAKIRKTKINSKPIRETLSRAKQMGFSDLRLAKLLKTDETKIRSLRKKLHISPVYKIVDTCAAEFEAHTPYLYSTYEKEDESAVSSRKKVIILGGGPNRIGQGIEFDYCCVHASYSLREEGYETIMVNCNPETVSTDYDTSDRLYFEPLTLEDVLHIVQLEKPDGVIVQFGGQTPLRLARALEKYRVPIIGTSPKSIDRAEDRKLFARLVTQLRMRQPENGTARSTQEAIRVANRIGYPAVIRPSYVLGGRGMEIVYHEAALRDYIERAAKISPDHPVLIDRFLEAALEVDVDAIGDGQNYYVAGIMEHIEQAGIHSGDSAMCLPPHSLSVQKITEIRDWTIRLAKELKVIGLMNIQFAIKQDQLYVLEVNPRASRTVPFVSKATGLPLAKIAAKLMIGRKLSDFSLPNHFPAYLSVKESVFPFNKFQGVDTLLGPEMRSTGEVMGIGEDFGEAFAKSQLAAGTRLPMSGSVFLSLRDEDKPLIVDAAKKLVQLGFDLVATRGTSRYLQERGIKVHTVNKVTEGSPHIVDQLERGEMAMVFNTPEGYGAAQDSFSIRRTALVKGIPYFTTVAAAIATVDGIESLQKKGTTVKSLQEYQNKKPIALHQCAG